MWLRQRQPQEVPPSVLAAVVDFCKQADPPPETSDVADALSVLSSGDDPRLLSILQLPPLGWAVGPWALVDLVSGTPAALCHERQSCGYYELARSLSKLGSQPADSGDAGDSRPNLPFQDRQQNLPKGRGRFTQVGRSKERAEQLLQSGAKEQLAMLVAQHRNRMALLRTLSQSYTGRAGVLDLTEILPAVEQHGLLDELKRQEREQLLGQLTEQRGALGRVAGAIGLTASELNKLIDESGLRREVDERRERFAKEALSPPSLTQRLDLLGKDRYLKDLGIQQRFIKELTRDLLVLFKESLADDPSIESGIERVARKYGAPGDLLLRAVTKLGLRGDLERLRSTAP